MAMLKHTTNPIHNKHFNIVSSPDSPTAPAIPTPVSDHNVPGNQSFVIKATGYESRLNLIFGPNPAPPAFIPPPIIIDFELIEKEKKAVEILEAFKAGSFKNGSTSPLYLPPPPPPPTSPDDTDLSKIFDDFVLTVNAGCIVCGQIQTDAQCPCSTFVDRIDSWIP